MRWRNCQSTSTTQRFELGRVDTAKSRLRWPLSIVLIDSLRSGLPTQAPISVKVAGVIHLSRTSHPDESLYGLRKVRQGETPGCDLERVVVPRAFRVLVPREFSCGKSRQIVIEVGFDHRREEHDAGDVRERHS